MKAELIHYSSAKKLLEIKDFKLQPTLEGEDFFKSANVQKTRYVVEFKKAVFSNLGLISLSPLILSLPIAYCWWSRI
jgi:hypothetical protein